MSHPYARPGLSPWCDTTEKSCRSAVFCSLPCHIRKIVTYNLDPGFRIFPESQPIISIKSGRLCPRPLGTGVGVAPYAPPGLSPWYDTTDIIVPQKSCRLLLALSYPKRKPASLDSAYWKRRRVENGCGKPKTQTFSGGRNPAAVNFQSTVDPEFYRKTKIFFYFRY